MLRVFLSRSLLPACVHPSSVCHNACRPWSAIPHPGPVLPPLPPQRVHPLDCVPAHLQGRRLRRHQGQWCHSQGHAAQVLPRPHRHSLERHQARRRRRHEQAGRLLPFLPSIIRVRMRLEQAVYYFCPCSGSLGFGSSLLAFLDFFAGVCVRFRFLGFGLFLLGLDVVFSLVCKCLLLGLGRAFPDGPMKHKKY